MRRQASDEGTTLVEMLVTMIVLGLLGTAVTLTVTSMTKTSQSTKARAFATEQAQVTIDRASRLVRATTPVGAGNVYVSYAGDSHLTLYSNLAQPNGPSLVDLNVTGPATSSTLVQSVTPADAGSNYTYTGTAAISRDGIDLDTTAGPIFTYYDISGNVLSTPMTTAAQTTRIARILITVVDSEAGSSSPVTDSTLIYLRNIEYG